MGLLFLIFMALIVRSCTSDLFTGYARQTTRDAGYQIPVRISDKIPGKVGVSSSIVLNPDSGEAYRRLYKETNSPTAADESTDAAILQAPKIQGPDWLLEQNPNTYTIQFWSSQDLDQLIQAAERFEQPVAIYPFDRTNGTIVYGVASGFFDTLQSAEASLSQLPPALLVDDPWIRPTGLLQQQIQTFR